LGCGSDRTQNIQFGTTQASRSSDQVAAHSGGYRVDRTRGLSKLRVAAMSAFSWCYWQVGGLCQDAAMAAAPLTGQVAVVTGASRGIGKAIAVHLARQGAGVAGIARPGPDLAALGRDADGSAGRLVPFAADVTSAGEVEAAFARVDADLGTPQLVVACAGTADVLGPLWLADPQHWWQAVAVDLRGTMLTAQCAIARMLAAGRGRLVTIYGNLGDRQQGYVSAFAVAKAGIARLTEQLACELAGTEVRVLGVHPGFVRTAMTEQLAWSEQGRAWLPGFGETAERRWADAQPAADLITAIALGEADQLTGRILHPRDDLSALTAQCQSQPDRRRLRLDLS
jgi:NAD(P)-dependent dehydrogenase (short-subunit alcohol dehydrogenase family)